MIDLSALELSPVDDRFKGIPGGTAPFALGAIADHGWNVLREDLPLPLAVLKQSALEHNGEWMHRFVELSGVDIAPHGKTTMSPQLFARQLELGAWAITIATINQLQLSRRFGVRRVIYANQLVGRQAIRYVLDELGRDRDLDLYCLVDSVENVHSLLEHCRERGIGRPLQLLLELGLPGGRAGCRTMDSALAVARAVKEAGPHLALRGIEAFEGIIPSGPAHLDDEARLGAFLTSFADLARSCEAQGLFAEGEVVLTAGGSAFFDIVAARLRQIALGRPTRVVIRSGCYLTHDARMYQEAFTRVLERSAEARSLGAGLSQALEIWAYVQSMPEKGRAVLTAGKRDCSFDASMPEPRFWYRPGAHHLPQALEGHVVTHLNDQHAYVDCALDTPLRVGDMVSLGISHPCTTFDKWQLIMVVDDSYRVVRALRTFF